MPRERRPSPAEPADPNAYPCEICGVAVPPTGAPLSPPGWMPPVLNPDGVRIPASTVPPRPPRLDPTAWATCATCTRLIGHDQQTTARVRLLGDLLGLDLDPADPAARAVVNPVEHEPLAPPYARDDRKSTPGTGSPERWAHVSDEQRAQLAAALDAAHRVQRSVRRVTLGPCGLCGVRTQEARLRWHAIEMPWPTPTRPSRWACCDACWTTVSPVGGSWDTNASARLLAAFLELAEASMTMADLLAPYAARAGTEPAAALGTDDRFGYVAADDRKALQRYVWQHWPRLAPLHVRRRADRVAAARRLVATAPASAAASAVTLPTAAPGLPTLEFT